MAKKNIVNDFLKQKKSRKKRLSKNAKVNRLIGSKIINTNEIVKSSKLKQIDFDTSLSRKTFSHGFKKLINEALSDQSKSFKKTARLINSHGYTIIASLINDLALNTFVIYRTLLVFLVFNVFYYSVSILLGLFYSPIIITLFLGLSYITALVVTIFKSRP